MSELCEVVITAPDPDWLYAFARSLVEGGLAASAHNFTPVRSIYTWQGQVHERSEGRVSLHTSRDRVPDIVGPVMVPGATAAQRQLENSIEASDPYFGLLVFGALLTAMLWAMARPPARAGAPLTGPHGPIRPVWS